MDERVGGAVLLVHLAERSEELLTSYRAATAIHTDLVVNDEVIHALFVKLWGHLLKVDRAITEGFYKGILYDRNTADNL